MKKIFPKNFLWGASSSAYQIEGGIICDWTEFEQKNKEKLVNKAKTYWSEKQKNDFPEMFNPDNYICGKACNSYEMMDEDIECLKKLNLNAYRFGIEWARIEPEKGKIDYKAIKHYRIFLKKLKKANIKAVITIWHWTNPVWLANEKGWANKKVIQYFTNYTKLLVNELGDLVDYWVSLNEPMMHIGHGYFSGKFPPNHKKDFKNIFRVLKNLISAHKNAYKVIHSKYPQAQVSVAMTTGYFHPANKYNLLEIILAKISHYIRNEWFLLRIYKYIDYIGVNYYHHDRIIWYPPFRKNLNKIIDDRGWEFYPKGIYYILKAYKKYKKPILILENGTADAKDILREKYIIEHLKYIHKAIKEGVNIKGYFYWSLLDNFEWAEGYWPKFGLYAVDKKNNFQRIIRKSALKYAEIVKNNKLE